MFEKLKICFENCFFVCTTYAKQRYKSHVELDLYSVMNNFSLIIILLPLVQSFILKDDPHMKIQNDLQPKKLLAESLQFITPGSKCGKTLTSVTSFTPNNLKEKPQWTYKCKTLCCKLRLFEVIRFVYSAGCMWQTRPIWIL